MGVQVLPGSEQAKELAKWEQFPTPYTTGSDGDAPVGNPYTFRAYPKMLYRAVERSDGKAVCMEPQPVPRGGGEDANARFQYEMLSWERHIQSCCRTVKSDDEERIALNDGWRPTPADALSAHEERAFASARAAAESAFDDRNMGELAQRERASYETEVSGHLTEVPEVKRGPGRPRKEP